MWVINYICKTNKKILAYMPTLVELIGENPLEEME